MHCSRHAYSWCNLHIHLMQVQNSGSTGHNEFSPARCSGGFESCWSAQPGHSGPCRRTVSRITCLAMLIGHFQCRCNSSELLDTVPPPLPDDVVGLITLLSQAARGKTAPQAVEAATRRIGEMVDADAAARVAVRCATVSRTWVLMGCGGIGADEWGCRLHSTCEMHLPVTWGAACGIHANRVRTSAV